MKSLSYVSALLLAVVFAIAQVLAAPQQGTGIQGTGTEGAKTEGTGITWGAIEAGTRVPMDQSMIWDQPMTEEQAGIGYGRRPSMSTMCMVVWNFCNDRREVAFNRPSLNAMCIAVRNYCTSDRRSSLVTRGVSEVETAQSHKPYYPPYHPPYPYPPYPHGGGRH